MYSTVGWQLLLGVFVRALSSCSLHINVRLTGVIGQLITLNEADGGPYNRSTAVDRNGLLNMAAVSIPTHSDITHHNMSQGTKLPTAVITNHTPGPSATQLAFTHGGMIDASEADSKAAGVHSSASGSYSSSFWL